MSLPRNWSYLLLLLLASCIEPFEPKVSNAPRNYLIVDGSINSRGVSTIRLSRTVGLTEKDAVPIETRASLYIEQEGGSRYPLVETKPGTYTSAALQLDLTKKVRLYFKTANQREYVSAFTAVKTTPALDSVSWRVSSQGVQLYANTHDETQQARYYRWSYDETWEFTSAYFSQIEFRNRKQYDRTEDIYHCWASESSTAIKLGSTVKLAQDVVSEAPLTLLPPTSVKLRYKYSILVKQYALTLEEYSYWETLRKNTENIGTLFDPLPTQLTGNVQCMSDPSEVVIGFVGAQSVTEKRIFIDYSQLPRTWVFDTGYASCVLDTLPRPKSDGKPAPPEDFFSTGFAIPISQFSLSGSPQQYYVYSSPVCVDCRKRGTNVRPSFWQ
jgi:hypothetical protein